MGQDGILVRWRKLGTVTGGTGGALNPKEPVSMGRARDLFRFLRPLVMFEEIATEFPIGIFVGH